MSLLKILTVCALTLNPQNSQIDNLRSDYFKSEVRTDKLNIEDWKPKKEIYEINDSFIRGYVSRYMHLGDKHSISITTENSTENFYADEIIANSLDKHINNKEINQIGETLNDHGHAVLDIFFSHTDGSVHIPDSAYLSFAYFEKNENGTVIDSTSPKLGITKLYFYK